MKTLKNLIKTALVAGAIGLAGNLYIPNKSFSQNVPKTSKEKLLPNLNFYFETGEYIHYTGHPEFKKYVEAWLSEVSKENKNGAIWFNYGDTDDDGVYDYVSVQKNSPPIKYQEKFSFNFDTKKIDYILEIYDCCYGLIHNCDKIITKSYNNIDQKEAEQLGEDFFERIKEFAKTQKEFSRFNSGQLEELVRKEYSSKLIMDRFGKLVGNSRIPIEKFLSEEEIKKVENYIQEKPERERLKKEQKEKLKELKRQQEEARKIEYEKQEKIRKEQEEARKPKARLKIGGGIAITLPRGHIGSFLGITPQFTNKKGKGFAIGLDMFILNSKMNFERSGGREDSEEKVGSYEYLISHTLYTHDILAKNTNRFGMNIGYVSPVCEIFANAGFLRQKRLAETTVVTEEYIEKYGIKQGESLFKTEKINWEKGKFFGPLYAGLGVEIFPFFKKTIKSNKNISFSLDGVIVGRDKFYTYYSLPIQYLNSPRHFIINAGIKYTFRK